MSKEILQLSPDVIVLKADIIGFITATDPVQGQFIAGEARNNIRVILRNYAGTIFIESCKTEKLAQKRLKELAKVLRE